MIFAAREQGVCGWKQFECSLPGTLLIAAAQMVRSLPDRRLDDGCWNLTTREHALNRTGRPPILKS